MNLQARPPGVPGEPSAVTAAASASQTSPPGTPHPERARLASLDGLRGVAAFVVLLHHVLLVVPVLAAAYMVRQGWTGLGGPGSIAWWLYRSPLRLLWAGPEALVVFFVLSGFVLTLLARSASRRGPWVLAYYARRFVRLYLPVWGAVVVGTVLAYLVPRATAGLSTWLQAHGGPGRQAVLWDLTLVDNTSTLNSPLWSLRIEVWFSLLLPLAWWALRRLPVGRYWPLWCTVLLFLSRLPDFVAVQHAVPSPAFVLPALQYLPLFGVGMVLAVGRPSVAELGAAVRAQGGRWGWPVLVLAACVLVPCATYGTGWWRGSWGSLASGFLSGVGVVVVFVAALEWPALVSALESRPVRWLGVRSYSLYLVHEPIVVASAIGLHAAGWWWLGPAVGVAGLCLGAAAVFHRLVERPAIDLSRRAGATVAAFRRRRLPVAWTG